MIHRRDFLLGLGAAGVLAGSGRSALAAAMDHRLPPAEATPGFDPHVELSLRAEPGTASMLEGAPTAVWRYSGSVLKGPADALSFLDGAGHIPVIRVRRGQRLRVHFDNALPEASIVHWHGLNIVQRMDGHPMYAIDPGQRYVYEFEVGNRAGSYWFHPHPHERTSWQVYQGMTGMLLISDEEEDAAQLPAGEQDLALVIQDRSFDGGNQLVYLNNTRHNWMMGFAGERVLVNGRADYQRQVARGAHRVRLFNGSNATLYHLRWSHGAPFTVIGTDGGLLAQPVEQPALTLGVGERADVWVDFSGLAAGVSVQLLAESWTPSLQHFTGEQLGLPLVDGARPIASFAATTQQIPVQPLPQRLSTPPVPVLEQAVNAGAPRRIEISMMMGSPRLNGRSFGAMDEVHDSDRVKLGSTEVWEFVNEAGMGMGMGMGGMMQMAHPMHVHNVSFRVLSRTRSSPTNATHQRLATGFTDHGLKDVVLVLPGERVQVLMAFENHAGLYLYHCHILEHEDLGMMRNYLIET